MNRRAMRVRSMGEIAAGMFAGAPALTVTAVFSRSVYAADAAGGLLCLVRGDLEPGPLNVVCGDWPEDAAGRIAPGDRLARERAGVWAGGALELDLSGAPVWTPPEWPRFDAASVARGMGRLPAVAARHAPGGSAATLLVQAGGTAASPLQAALLAKLKTGARAFRRWLGDPDRFPDPGFPSLLGLGIGLTPSGDDVVAGTLLALRAVARNDLADRVAARLRGEGARRTNPISLAHLAAAARGAGAAALHAFLAELLAGGRRLETLAPRLARVGHTSGWDAVFGMALALGDGDF